MESKGNVIISPLLAHSIVNQAELIKKLVEELGYRAVYQTTISSHDVRRDENVAFLWVRLALAEFLGGVTSVYMNCKKPKAIYVTIEGVPTKGNVLYSPLKNLEFIANSNFTAECLSTVGFKVVDVIHHGIDIEECEKAIKAAPKKWGFLKDRCKDRCKVLYVGRNDPRKALSKLSTAINMVNETHRDRVVFIIYSEESAGNLFKQENVIFLPMFGRHSHVDVLALMAYCDYLVFPSVSEGFGLPVLEANAVGRPAIHCWFPPLNEFSNDYFNFVWDYETKELVKCGLSQYWIFHQYPDEILAESIVAAIDTFFESKERYEEYCEKAKEHARQWDYRKVYRKLLGHLKLT